MSGNTLLELRRDTAANWTSANPILAAGEPGWESDTGKLKLGDGTTAWASLAYFGAVPLASAADVQAGSSTTKAVTPNALQVAAAPQTLTAGATISWDMSQGFNAKVTLGSAANAFNTPTNPVVGLTYALELIQDGTGGRTASYPSAFDFGGAGTPTLSTGASKHDFIFLYCYDAGTPKFRASFNKGS